MDTVLGLRLSHRRPTDWVAAAVAGLAAGAVLMVLDMVWSSIFTPGGPWRTSHMIAPIFTGTHPAGSGYVFSVAVVSISLATHYILGIVFGLVLAPCMTLARLDTSLAGALQAGAGSGIALYLVNFEFLTSFFPWLADLRGGDTLAAHVVFGVVAALLYRRLKRSAPER